MRTPRLPALLLAAALLAPTGSALAAGSSGASFLRVGQGARAAAMGEAFTAAADDVDALYWNPAGLTQVKRLQMVFDHAAWLDNTGVEHAAFAVRTGTAAVAGAGLTYLNTGDIRRANKYGYEEGFYSAGDLALTFAYARQFRKFRAGASAKVVQERIESSSARAFAADAGVLLQPSARLRLGASLKNLGSSLTLYKTAAPLPMSARAGLALQFTKNLLLAADAHLPFDDSLSLHFGAEYQYPSTVKGARLSLRAGFKTSAMSYLGAAAGASVGFGLEAGAVGFDYALAPYGDLGLTHRLGLKIKFDSLAAKQEVPQLTVTQGGRKVKRGAAEVYAETLQWLDAKTASEKLSKEEQETILKRIVEKFSALGVDVTLARQRLGGGNAAPAPKP